MYFFITDYYLEDLVKLLERRCRSEISLIRMKASRRDQRVPKQFNKFLRLFQNKMDLAKFLNEDWSTNLKQCRLLERNELYVKVEARAFKISSHSGKLSKTYVEELSRHQEEADRKMFLAARFLFELGFVKVNIITIDTDVAVYYQFITSPFITSQY